MNKRLFIVATLLGLFVSGSLVFQLWQLYNFINAGPRFTAQDGQELCERIRALERYSYGYRDAGKSSVPCDYFK